MDKLKEGMNDFFAGFWQAAIGTVRYGYFAPLTALYFAMTRPGGYFWHIRALYRLCAHPRLGGRS